MRVLHFFKIYLPDSMGGIEQAIYQICESVHPYGIESEVLTLSSNPSPTKIVIENHVVFQSKLDLNLASTGISLEVFAKFKELSKSADIIHYHFPWPFMDIVHFISNIKKPYIITYHSDIVRQKVLSFLYTPLMNKFLSGASKIIAASPNYLETSKVLTKFKSNTVVIPYGLDRAGYKDPIPTKLSEWESKFGRKFFLFVGVMRYYKGLHILLEAIQDTNYPLVILGAGPMEQKLKEQANLLGLKNVYFLGRLGDEDKISLLKLCSSIVFPSHLRSEAFGISLLEGAMFGKPMISSEIGTGTSYINIHNETGIVVPPGNPEALREAMSILWNDPKLAEEMGKKALDRFESLFTSKMMGEKMANLYKDTLNKS
jgi:rhamnosyl/mannosyltransferase